MILELIALVDYIEIIIAYNEPERLYVEPIETIYLNYTDKEIISNIDMHLQAGSHQEILNLIDQFKVDHKELLTIYESIGQVYENYKEYLSAEDLIYKIKNDYGVNYPEEIVAILRGRDHFLVEH
jgi:hypothetical protein